MSSAAKKIQNIIYIYVFKLNCCICDITMDPIGITRLLLIIHCPFIRCLTERAEKIRMNGTRTNQFMYKDDTTQAKCKLSALSIIFRTGEVLPMIAKDYPSI
jgi:hypothetical protein